MCGIVGYVGDSNAVPFLLEGLGRLEYRGYDSAGVAVLNHGKIEIRKAVGHVSSLVEEIKCHPVSGTSGISHTRWATHGRVTLENAHPHRDGSGKLALVHNGVVENHKDLRAELESRGHIFASQTDTEVISRLIGEAFDGHGDKSREGLVEAAREALQQVRGTYAIGVLHEDLGDFLLAARRGSPLALGLGDGGQFLASDPAAIAGWASNFVYLNEGEIALLDGKKFDLAGIDGRAAAPVVVRSMEKAAKAGTKGEFEHFMKKEIHEQPETLREAMRGRLIAEQSTACFHGIERSPEELRQWETLIFTGCGTSFNAALAGEYIIEFLSRVPVECEIASEFRYRNSPLEMGTAVFALSQSGETADTLAAMREIKRRGAPTFGICNNPFSTISRESDGGIDLRAGQEVGVAATKSFTSQVLVPACEEFLTPILTVLRLQLLAYHIGVELGCDVDKPRNLAKSVTVE